MKTLQPELLSAELFKPFGDVIEMHGVNPVTINSGNCLRYSDLASLDIDGSGAAGISLFDAKPYANPITLTYVERHPLGSQAFMPMNTEPFIVVVASDNNGAPEEPRVFITDGRQGVNYARNTWHGVLTPINSPSLFAVVDYIGNENNLEERTFETPYLIEYQISKYHD